MQNLCFFGILTFSLPHPKNERPEPKNPLLFYTRTFRLACKPSLPCTDPVKPLEAITAEKQARQNLIQRTFETCTSIAHHNWGVNLYWAKSCQSRVFVDINGINHLVKAFEAQFACPYLPQELPPSEPGYHICFICLISPATFVFQGLSTLSPIWNFLCFTAMAVAKPRNSAWTWSQTDQICENFPTKFVKRLKKTSKLSIQKTKSLKSLTFIKNLFVSIPSKFPFRQNGVLVHS